MLLRELSLATRTILAMKTAFVVFWLLVNIEIRGQEKILPPEEIQQLVPNYLKGFDHNPEVKASLIKIGNIQYTLCEHRFSKRNRTVRVLLFDFKDARIMYDQATREWKNYAQILSDSVTRRSVMLTNCTGWESYYKNSNTSQIYLGICDRFFLEIRGEGVPLETLKLLLNEFRFIEFPK